jgi:cytoskeletal protein CcmA (bactofilin family)
MAWGAKRDTTTASVSTDQVENVLGKSAHVRGDLKADGAFRVDGTIEGSVESKSSIVIGESGIVRGDVRGRDVVVAGQVQGNITASGHLDIVASGRIEGDVDALSVRIETGGVFRGTSRMGGGKATASSSDDDSEARHLASVK